MSAVENVLREMEALAADLVTSTKPVQVGEASGIHMTVAAVKKALTKDATTTDSHPIPGA